MILRSSNMRNLLAFVFILIGFLASSQVSCFVNVTPNDTTICPGDSILISAQAAVTTGSQSFNFDSGSLPPGWTTTGTTAYSTPCGPGPNGSPYFWASTSGTATPTVTTAEFDVECGGNIVFEMVYAVQSGAAPCEGPDLANEGVELQYSIDGGLTWITIVYYSPGGYELPSNPGTTGSVASGATPYTTWGTFSVTIPPGAMTTNTMFQWVQTNSSGTCCDNWGLENIAIEAGPCQSAVVNWNNGYNDTTSFWATPTSDTAFVAYVYDTLGILQCTSDSINIFLNSASLLYDLIDTVVVDCPTDVESVEVTNLQFATSPITYLWSTGSTTNPTDLGTNGEPHDTIPYYVTITDGCGFVYDDSVIMIVDQILQVDTTIANPSSACLPDGAVSAVVSGLQGTPLYEWTGPGQNSPNFYQATVWIGVAPGWYYFSVQDDACIAYDSVFVEPLNPPIANVVATPTVGCGPLNVTFTNNSENTTDFLWDFGNGDPLVSESTLAGQSATYLQSGLMIMIASDANGCADTAYVSISVEPCGCTDPIADNYSPFATIDDGSCIYPVPTVYAPNVFTPNLDGDNDVFFLTTTNTVEIELVITNRWGNVMYESVGPNPGWDGLTQSGTESAEGVYFYRYVATGPNGDTVEGHGFLHLVRD